jgi:hypothetical protein
LLSEKFLIQQYLFVFYLIDRGTHLEKDVASD